MDTLFCEASPYKNVVGLQVPMNKAMEMDVFDRGWLQGCKAVQLLKVN